MQIAVYRGRQLRSTHRLEGRPVVVGRSAECDIVVAHEVVSRQHLRLRPVDGGLEATDLETANGTFIDGERITTRRVSPGDRIELGNWVLVVERAANDLGLPPLSPKDSMPPPYGETSAKSPDQILSLIDRANRLREAHLAWVDGAGPQARALPRSGLTLGFGDSVDIALRGSSLFAQAVADLRYERRSWTVTAITPLVGVKVNGKKTRQEPLVDGDTIEIKGQTFRFRAAIG